MKVGDRRWIHEFVERAPVLDQWLVSTLADPEANAELDYPLAGELARETIARDDAGLASDVVQILSATEWALKTSDVGTRKIVVVGFIESLQNVIAAESRDEKAWTRRLGPEGKKYWALLEDLWQGRVSPLEFNRQVDGEPSE